MKTKKVNKFKECNKKEKIIIIIIIIIIIMIIMTVIEKESIKSGN